MQRVEPGRSGESPSAKDPRTPARTSDFVCRVCGNAQDNRPITAREMMFGSREEFDYVECASCGTVQMAEIPSDLGRFYPSSRYFAFAPSPAGRTGPVHRLMEALTFRAFVRPSFDHGGAWYRRLSSLDLTDPGAEAVGRANVRRDARVLEVGCGNGRLLRILEGLGFTHLRGVDPFLPGDTVEGAITLQKRDVADLDRASFFDLIVLYHSLEHVPDPVGTLRAVRSHLTGDGVVVVAMPIVAAAFHEYGTNWYQLDPPRHLHVFSVKSFEIALARSGLRLTDHYFNSTAAQFRLSEAYAHNVALSEIPPPVISLGRGHLRGLLSAQEAKYRHRAHALNAAAEGDQAVFYLRRSADATRAG